MSQVVRYSTDSGTAVAFEITPVSGFVPAGSADEVEVKSGVKVTGTMSWLVAKAASEGNFEVTLSRAKRRDAAS